MTLQRKLMYGAGGLLLLLVFVIAAFSLGVYVGRYGLTRSGLSLQGPRNLGPPPPAGRPEDQAPAGQPGAPRQSQPPGGQPEPRPEGQPLRALLPSEPTLVGRILRISPSALDLATRDGPRRVAYDSETEVWNEAGEETSLNAMTEGQIMAIFGELANGGQRLQADLIVILPLPEPGEGQPRPPGSP